MSLEDVRITIMSGAEDGKVLTFKNTPIMLGRHPEDNVFLPYDNRVSRHHARITQEGNICFIEDVGADGRGTKNGTYVNDIRITSRTAIASGQMVFLGAIWVKFETAISQNT
jgi:pSer/pThr/pTyr-binding forkhead associated (FHA) protein